MFRVEPPTSTQFLNLWVTSWKLCLNPAAAFPRVSDPKDKKVTEDKVEEEPWTASPPVLEFSFTGLSHINADDGVHMLWGYKIKNMKLDANISDLYNYNYHKKDFFPTYYVFIYHDVHHELFVFQINKLAAGL